MGQSTADAARKKHEEEVLRLKIIVEERAAADVIKNKVAVLQGLLSGLQVELSDKEEFIKYILEASPKWVSKAAAYRGIGQ
jgi:hypothetical protein